LTVVAREGKGGKSFRVAACLLRRLHFLTCFYYANALLFYTGSTFEQHHRHLVFFSIAVAVFQNFGSHAFFFSYYSGSMQ
jgi:hypothetical protein